MDIRRMGLAVCLMGAAYSASAGYTWSEFQAKPAGSDKPVLATHGYTWSEYQAATNPSKTAPALATHGYTWSEYKPKTPAADKPALVTHGYTWSE